MTDVLDLDAVTLSALIRTAEVSPVEVVEASLAAIETRDSTINSVVVVLADAARIQAREAERAVRAGEPLGALHGVPLTVKEPIWVRDAPATNGSRALADFRAPSDALAVARLRQAGAIVIGKSNAPDMLSRGLCDNPIYGATYNPWRDSRSSGGSSGGAAASIALGLTPLALGSDGGGSIRAPASFCGVAGFKPTRGAVAMRPSDVGEPTVTVIGPLARTVEDLGLAFDVLAGPTVPRAATSPLELPRVDDRAAHLDWARGLRVAYSPDLGFASCDDDVRTGFDAQIAMLRDAGWNVCSAHPQAADAAPIWGRIFEVEFYAHFRQLYLTSPGLLNELVIELGRSAEAVKAYEYVEAHQRRRQLIEAWEQFFVDYDVLITPATTTPALAADRAPSNNFASMLFPANATGQPALAVPSFFVDGMPMGLQMVTRRGGDRLLLRAGAAYEALRGPLPSPRDGTSHLEEMRTSTTDVGPAPIGTC